MPDTLTPEERERLTSAMVAARTEPGYWFDGGSGKIGDAEPEAGIGEMDNESDAALAVAAVNALPSLLATLAAQEAELDEARKGVGLVAMELGGKLTAAEATIERLREALDVSVREYLKWGLLDKRAETDYFGAWAALNAALTPESTEAEETR